jgi:hypothetical protein
MSPVLLNKCNVENVLFISVKESYGWLFRGQDRLGTLYLKWGLLWFTWGWSTILI